MAVARAQEATPSYTEVEGLAGKQLLWALTGLFFILSTYGLVARNIQHRDLLGFDLQHLPQGFMTGYLAVIGSVLLRTFDSKKQNEVLNTVRKLTPVLIFTLSTIMMVDANKHHNTSSLIPGLFGLASGALYYASIKSLFGTREPRKEDTTS